MRRILIAAAVLLAGACGALAQTSPGLIYGQVPTPAEWNNFFAIKADYLGAPYCPVTGCTLTGELITATPTTASAGLNLPVGTAPSSPNNGDMWITSSGLFIRVGGTTVGPMAASGSCLTCALTNVTNTFAILQVIDLGSGSNEPASDTGTALAVYGANATVARIEDTAFGAAATVSLRSSLGTRTAPTTLTTGTLIASYNVHGYDGSVWTSTSYGAVHIYAEANWSSTSHPTEICLATTPTTSSAAIADNLCQHDDGSVTMPGKLSLGTTGTLAGSIVFFNATNGTITVQPPAGALGSATLTLPDVTDTLAAIAASQALTNKTITSSTNTLGGVTMSLGSDATGDIYYRNSGGALTRLGIGTSGFVLTVSGGLPAWVTAGAASSISVGSTTVGSAGGSNEILTTGTVSAGSGTLANVTVGTGLQISGGSLSVTSAVALLTATDQTLTGGTNVTPASLSTGSVAIDCGQSPLQYITNGGAFTITAPSSDGSCLLLVTNNASANSNVVFSGFAPLSNTGAAFTSTNGNKFTVSIWRINGVAGYFVVAMQ